MESQRTELIDSLVHESGSMHIKAELELFEGHLGMKPR
jgi:hypothetical protein